MIAIEQSQSTDQATKDRILYFAKKEFAEKGYGGARIGEIARRAGVNQALVHYYFDNKENLYTQMLKKLFSFDETDKIATMIKQWHLKPSEELYIWIYITIHYQLSKTDPDFHRLVLREMTEEKTPFKEMIQEFVVPKISQIETSIRKGVRNGEFETPHSLFTVMQIFAFTINYTNDRKLFANTKLYKRLYGKNKEKEIFQFVLESTFKALRPKNKPLHIPKIQPEILKTIDKIIIELKHSLHWHKTYEPSEEKAPEEEE